MGSACSKKYGEVKPLTNGKVSPSKRRADGVFERFAIKDGSFNIKLLPREKKISINSATFLPTGDIVIADRINNKLKLYNCNFEYLACLEFQSPVQYVSSSENLPLIYAVFPDRVRQIHVDGANMKRSGFIKTPGECTAMCVNKFDGKAISMIMEDGYGQVNLLTPGGNLQIEINEDHDGEGLFVTPGSLIVTRDLNIVVADPGAQATIGVMPTGHVLFTYRGIRAPSAIACDELNYLYVAGPLNIHQLSSAGELLKIFLTKAEIGFSPLSLSYNEKKRQLFATGNGAKVSIFKLADV